MEHCRYNEIIANFLSSIFSSDLDTLTVKELKQILMLNRVDFKGCCEKTELLDRVKRLWNDANTCPGKPIHLIYNIFVFNKKSFKQKKMKINSSR